jgi:ribosomal 50S subunit-recycling heat shock protein
VEKVDDTLPKRPVGMPQALNLTVGVNDGGMRVDRWLSDQVPEITRHTVQRLCAAGKVRQNGRIAKKSDPSQ